MSKDVYSLWLVGGTALLVEDTTQPALQSAPEQPSGLRIIQRSPQEQPECLFISGRMADVCAALERLEAHGGAAAN